MYALPARSYQELPRAFDTASFCRWFITDICSVGASIFDIIPMVLTDGSAENMSALSALRVVRILRLAKLIRLLRASKRVKEWSVKLATPQSVLTVISTLLECMYLVHLFACVLGLVTIIPESPLDTWLATHGYCT